MSEPIKKTKRLSPSEFLRERRPEQFSDSIINEQPEITKNLLEYHLETLTNRSQEKEFEHFSRKLAEKEICPNLLPQTGPTGGGDSKVDTETYPVAEEISIRWYYGEAASKERWAFAISAKKEWRSKIRSDVEKIANTKRDYALIYFITNQYVKDKDRANIEDELTKKFDIPVRILDRNWILDKVITANHFNLVRETLDVEGLQLKQMKAIGPMDAEREIELGNLDAQISDPERYLGIPYQLAEDCLTAATLASELELDRNLVDSRFHTALRIAKGNNNQKQVLRITYRHAWVTCFVYDDVYELSRLYSLVEELGLDSDDSFDVEKVNNLWNVLLNTTVQGFISPEKSDLKKRGELLKQKLIELSDDESRPNNSLHARSMLCLHELTEIMYSGAEESKMNEALAKFSDIIEDSRGLGEYPFETYKTIVLELGNIFPENEAYEKLFELIISQSDERTSEAETARLITDRGIQKLRAGKFYEAIKLFGKSQDKLIKEEYDYEFIKSLTAIGSAYKCVGLNWAARSSFLAAIAKCLNEYERSGYLNRFAFLAIKELIWIEIKLARIPQILVSVAVLNFIYRHMDRGEQDDERYREFIAHFDAVFSILLLRLNIEQLKKLLKLPYLLEDLNLFCSESTVLFTIGELEVLTNEPDESRDHIQIEEFYESLASQPAAHDLPQSPDILDQNISTLKSLIMGVDISFYVDTHPASILVAESLLTVIEAFLSTCLENKMFIPHRESICIRVSIQNNLSNDLGIKSNENCKNWDLEVLHLDSFNFTNAQLAGRYQDFVVKFTLSLLSKIAIINLEKDDLLSIFKSENLFNRSLLSYDVSNFTQMVFGDFEWINIEDLCNRSDKDVYRLRREQQWKPKLEDISLDDDSSEEFYESISSFRHDEVKVQSILDLPVWNKADWFGAAFGIHVDRRPIFGLFFKNEEYARQIFEGWIKQFGKEFKNNTLRISIIRGVDKNNPSFYKIVISKDLDKVGASNKSKSMVVSSRILTITPENDRNLELFLKQYQIYKNFYLLPAISRGNNPEFILELIIEKTNLVVKYAWEIGEGDQDSAAISLDDNPIIPVGTKDPPILSVLNRLKAIGQRT